MTYNSWQLLGPFNLIFVLVQLQTRALLLTLLPKLQVKFPSGTAAVWHDMATTQKQSKYLHNSQVLPMARECPLPVMIHYLSDKSTSYTTCIRDFPRRLTRRIMGWFAFLDFDTQARNCRDSLFTSTPQGEPARSADSGSAAVSSMGHPPTPLSSRLKRSLTLLETSSHWNTELAGGTCSILLSTKTLQYSC